MRKWAKEQALSPEIKFIEPTKVEIKNFRDFTYDKNGIKRELFDTVLIDVNKINSAWYVVSPFGFLGMAHVFAVFDCDGRHVAVSFEARREKDFFNPLSGVFGKYEFMGVVGSERDLMQLRVVKRNENVHIYPLKINPSQTRELFGLLMRRVQDANTKETSYHTFLNNCTNNFMKELDKVGAVGAGQKKIGFSWKVVFPGLSAKLLHELGYIDNSIEYDKHAANANVSEKILQYQDHPEFSAMIRV